jgi:ERCC4-type nuclease
VIRGLFDWSQKPEEEHGTWLVRRPRVEAILERDTAVNTLSVIPSVGPKTAKELLTRLGNIRNVANATEEQLMDIKGIGPERASVIARTFSEEWQGGINSARAKQDRSTDEDYARVRNDRRRHRSGVQRNKGKDTAKTQKD